MKQDALDYFLAALGALFRMRRIYPQGTNQIFQSNKLAAQKLAEWGRPVRITFLGNDAIVEDRRISTIPPPYRALFQTLRQLGFERVQIEADAGEDDLTDWVESLISWNRSPYQGPKIMAGSTNLERRPDSHSVLTRTVAGYLGFLAEVQDIISDLESKKSEGLIRAREIVRSIITRLAVGKDLFEPIREMKNFDDYTYTHALNVCVLSSALARALRLSDEMVNTIATAALCHDLGKLEVPRKVLNYQGPLEPDDWVIMEKHPSCGAKLLLDIPGIESSNPLLPIVAYQHHIGANHSGYPRVHDHLSHHPLHFASLLISVADVYDALRTVRPYRQALTVAQTATVLIREAFSGKLHKKYVSAFLLLLNVLSPGQRVVLSDGSRGIIVETSTRHPLTPMVGDESGRVRDLSDPSAPSIWEFEEDTITDLQLMSNEEQSTL